MKIPFSPPYIDDDVRSEVLAALDSGWITSGPRVLALERLVAEKTGAEQVACCSSATAGLMLALHWYGIGPGDEVIIPSYTYAATALVVMHLGARPVMVDVNDDFNINVDDVKRKMSHKTKAIIPVDIGGWPCDYNSLCELVNSRECKRTFVPGNEDQKNLGRVMVLADAAHSIGAVYMDKPVGQWADFTVFSFHAVKNITTAEGGAICINLPKEKFTNEAIYKQLKLWSLNGQTKDALSKTNGAGWKYDIVYQGFKMNLPDICAAIGLAQLRKYHDIILPARKRVYQTYRTLFQKHPWAQLPPADSKERTSSYHLFALRVKNITEGQRDAMIDFAARQGVSLNVHFQPLPQLTLFREKGYDILDFPIAFDNYSREISLPVYPELDEEKVLYIVGTLENAYKSVTDPVKVNL